MLDSKGSSVRRRQIVDWVGAVADLAGNGLTMLRRMSEAVGTLTVGMAVALVMVPSVRESAVKLVHAWLPTSAFAAEAPADEAAGAEAPRAEPARWVHLQPTEARVAQYLSRRYHVADEAVRPLVLAAREAGQETQVDPLLILAVMAVESSLNPFAESPVGAQGLMQVMTSVHLARWEGGERIDALEPLVNIRMGSAILSDAIRRGGSVERGLQLYCGAGNLPDDGGYAGRVLSEESRLKMAAAGDVAAALVAGTRIDAKSAGGSGSAMAPTPAAPPDNVTESSS